MGSRGMATVLRNNKIMKRDRVSIYDKKRVSGGAPYQKLVDHKSMNTWEYAAFQKKQFAQKRLEKRKRIILYVVTIVAVIVVVFSLPRIIEFVFDTAYLDVKY